MSSNPLFKFELWPITEVAAYERDEGKCLHWFGLTDGWYTIDCGGTELLRYSQRLIDATPDWKWRTPYFDYQVARLYEDVLEVLTKAIDPIPSDILDFVRTQVSEQAFLERSFRWSDQYWPALGDSSPEDRERFDQRATFWSHAAGWWINRALSSGHVAGQPNIRFWCENETLTIRWVNDCKVEETTGLPWSDVFVGQHTMPVAEFLEEVSSFHDRLISAMQERVNIARNSWPRPDVAIDAQRLLQEHQERIGSLERTLKYAADTRQDWDAVREAVWEVVRLVGA